MFEWLCNPCRALLRLLFGFTLCTAYLDIITSIDIKLLVRITRSISFRPSDKYGFCATVILWRELTESISTCVTCENSSESSSSGIY